MRAVWKEQHASFFYEGRTARYSCDGLRDKVRALLLDLGARRDVTVVSLGCGGAGPAAGAGPVGGSAAPSLSIVFAAPALPHPAAKPLHAGDLAATAARFETFTITLDAFRNLGIGDCELVEEFTRQLLPRLATRNVRQDIACTPGRGDDKFLVQGEILRALPDAGH
jgi:hypothetical protein